MYLRGQNMSGIIYYDHEFVYVLFSTYLYYVNIYIAMHRV